ncbi:uncharacterized protein YecE (DUF72 family) [Acidovorax temperans]|uniref:Uncharacterized protein YecE (DUF72 family) n=1 Tax=Acidovorax temperans TaxID=80878 RepID=A0A543LHZ7_9BURK|nr:DUF72 domain-containing protein [Acidovorax temperans]TQN06952.1 uncharacterized protein YecE (DUF72 family) [Acidovorax temperans]
MQDDLFGAPPAPPAPPPASGPADAAPAKRGQGLKVCPAPQDDALHALAQALPPQLRMGTSSWTYPAWNGLVWDAVYEAPQLSKQGLAAYAAHPLLRTVSLDRNFYRPLTVSQYQRYAEQVPEDFRFVVKAPSLVTDALVRTEDGRGREPNPAFLNPELALREFVEPALEGLGSKVGALVFQISPLPMALLDRMPQVLEQLRTLLQALPPVASRAPDGVIAVEVRDPEWLTPEFAAVLRNAGATYCLGLHPKLPPLADQLPLLRALWPTPLVCRWNLNEVHGPYGYEDAEKRYAPYDRLHDLDPATHEALAKVIVGITGRGQNAYVTISNHAEGCAPLTVQRLAQHVRALHTSASPSPSPSPGTATG